MDLGISGRVALVTGAGRGIGAEIARTLAAEGVRIAVNDLFQERADESGGGDPRGGRRGDRRRVRRHGLRRRWRRAWREWWRSWARSIFS